MALRSILLLDYGLKLDAIGILARIHVDFRVEMTDRHMRQIRVPVSRCRFMPRDLQHGRPKKVNTGQRKRPSSAYLMS
jgi:hypothetical protein